MSGDSQNDDAQARAERAKRLHEEIEALKKGERPHQSNRPQSIREQIDERSREQREKAKPSGRASDAEPGSQEP